MYLGNMCDYFPELTLLSNALDGAFFLCFLGRNLFFIINIMYSHHVEGI